MAFMGDWDHDALTDEKLAVFVLNVGHGDTIVIRFPKVEGRTVCGVVDCYKWAKTREALKDLGADEIAFLCATHPHSDHMRGFESLIEWCVASDDRPTIKRFLDSGFRHVSKYHHDLIRCLQEHPEIPFLRVTSGFELTINKVRVLVMAPSIYLRNRYDTFGTEINNASIVLKLEYPAKDVAKYYEDTDVYSDDALLEEEKIRQNTMILGADAQFASWARLTQEFPQQTRYRGSNRGQKIAWRPWREVTHKPLYSQVLKVPHHMSKNGISYEVIKNLRSKYAVVSCSNTHLHSCPHDLTIDAAAEADCETFYTGNEDAEERCGTIGVLFEGDGGDPDIYSLSDTVAQYAPI